MTLNEVKVLLSENNIPFKVFEYENEGEFLRQTTLFPYIKNARDCKVIALEIASYNGKKSIELQFIPVDNEFCFAELYFGDYCFEMLDYDEDMLAGDMLEMIQSIQGGALVVIIKNDLKKQKRLADACFYPSDDDDVFGRQAFEKAMQRIRKPKGILSALINSQKQYEIYDWNTYQCIVK